MGGAVVAGRLPAGSALEAVRKLPSCRKPRLTDEEAAGGTDCASVESRAAARTDARLLLAAGGGLFPGQAPTRVAGGHPRSARRSSGVVVFPERPRSGSSSDAATDEVAKPAQTPLGLALRLGKFGIANKLIAAGANVDLPCEASGMNKGEQSMRLCIRQCLPFGHIGNCMLKVLAFYLLPLGMTAREIIERAPRLSLLGGLHPKLGVNATLF